jgi:hypothetical protein
MYITIKNNETDTMDVFAFIFVAIFCLNCANKTEVQEIMRDIDLLDTVHIMSSNIFGWG